MLIKGGLGITPMEPLRGASYDASRSAALEHRKASSAWATQIRNAPVPLGSDNCDINPPNDEFVTEEKYHNGVREELLKDKSLAPIIMLSSQKGQFSWITSKVRLVPSSKFKLAIMPRFALKHPRLPNDLLCPGCKCTLTSATALNHIPGCVKCSGVNATTKHNALVRYIHDLCLKSGLVCEKEPREFATLVCASCQSAVTEETRLEHQRSCHGNIHRSGPDLAVYWADGTVFYDLTDP